MLKHETIHVEHIVSSFGLSSAGKVDCLVVWVNSEITMKHENSTVSPCPCYAKPSSCHNWCSLGAIFCSLALSQTFTHILNSTTTLINCHALPNSKPAFLLDKLDTRAANMTHLKEHLVKSWYCSCLVSRTVGCTITPFYCSMCSL